MNTTWILPALPAAAAIAGLVFAAGTRWPRSRWVALGWMLASLPALAAVAYRFWDHHVGPDPFSLWRFALSPANLALLLPLAGISPLLFLAAEARGKPGWREALSSALSCLALVAAMVAALCDHLFLLAAACGLATLCAAGAAAARGAERRRGLAASFLPLAFSDLCLALGVLILYLTDPARGLFFPALPLEAKGWNAAACALMLAAALLRLGCLPFQRWMAGLAQGGRKPALVHVLAVNLPLGAWLLYLVTQVFFLWGGTWAWVCLGVSVLTLAVVARELLSARGGAETWGLLAAAVGAHLALAASPGGQAAGATLRLGLWAGVSALAMLMVGSAGGRARSWAGALGALSILGLPPLAGFAWRCMEFQVLAGEFSGGVSAVFPAAMAVSFAAVLVEGFRALRMAPAAREDAPAPGGKGDAAAPGGKHGAPDEAGKPGASSAAGREGAPLPAAVAAGAALAAFSVAVGLYPGKWVDLLMREYGMPLTMPFRTWNALGWAVLLCSAAAVSVLAAAGARRRAASLAWEIMPNMPDAWMKRRRWLGMAFSGGAAYKRVVAAGEALLCAGWIATLVYLALR